MVNQGYPGLSFTSADFVCRGFGSIADNVTAVADELVNRGFSAFTPLQDWAASFCQTEACLIIHRALQVEKAKNLLMRPWPLSFDFPDEKFFSSDYIRELTRERDLRNGCPVEQLNARFPGEIWRFAIDPCLALSMKASMQQAEEYMTNWNLAEAKARAEIIREAGGACECPAIDRSDSMRCIRAAAADAAARLGFSVLTGNSKVVLIKKISNLWNLCWSVEKLGGLSISGAPYGYVEFDLSLRAGGYQKKSNSRKCLTLRVADCIPYFTNVYGKFLTEAELRVSVMANMALLEISEPFLLEGFNRLRQVESINNKSGHLDLKS